MLNDKHGGQRRNLKLIQEKQMKVLRSIQKCERDIHGDELEEAVVAKRIEDLKTLVSKNKSWLKVTGHFGKESTK